MLILVGRKVHFMSLIQKSVQMLQGDWLSSRRRLVNQRHMRIVVRMSVDAREKDGEMKIRAP